MPAGRRAEQVHAGSLVYPFEQSVLPIRAIPATPLGKASGHNSVPV